MATPVKTIKIGALSLDADPHPSESVYVSLLKAARAERTPKKYWGNRYALITSVYEMADRPGFYFGQVWTFIDFDRKKPWFDANDERELTEEEFERHAFPDHLKPDLRKVDYLLTDDHRVLVDITDTQPSSFQRIFFGILNRDSVRKKAGVKTVHVTVEQSPDKINEILALKKINSLKITIRKPNGDVPDELVELFASEFSDTRTDEISIEWKSQFGMILNEKIKNSLELARRKGRAKARGKEEVGDKERSRVIDTKEHPREEVRQYVEGEKRKVDVMASVAGQIKAGVR